MLVSFVFEADTARPVSAACFDHSAKINHRLIYSVYSKQLAMLPGIPQKQDTRNQVTIQPTAASLRIPIWPKREMPSRSGVDVLVGFIIRIWLVS